MGRAALKKTLYGTPVSTFFLPSGVKSALLDMFATSLTKLQGISLSQCSGALTL